jgi:tetratricopeptide (TPR) repeat protein
MHDLDPPPVHVDRHIPDDALAALDEDRLPEEEALRLFGHIAACPYCEHRLNALSDSPASDKAFDTPLPVVESPPVDSLIHANELIVLDFLGEPRPDFPADRVLGKYRVIDLIDAGGCAIVLEGFDDTLGIQVAIKVLKDCADATARHRFRREARSAGELKDIRQIVRVLGADLEHEPAYFAMDFVPGERLDKAGQLAPRDAARIALDVATGLARMHEKNWVHQDIKPQNILVPSDIGRKRPWIGRALKWPGRRKTSGDWDAKILDLGLAFREEPGTSRPRGYTEGYASPEQTSPKGKVGSKSDVFSLGATLFHMLTGAPPSSRSEKKVREQLRKSRAPRPLVDICVESLRKEPRDRPPSGEVARSLRAYLGRPRRLLLACVAISLGVVIFLVAVVVHRERQGRRDAEARETVTAGRLDVVNREATDLLQALGEERELLLLKAGAVPSPGEELPAFTSKVTDPKIQVTAERVRGHVALLDKGPRLRADPRTDIILRTSKAALAIAYGEFDQALRELPAAVVDSLPEVTGEQVQIAHDANHARAIALGETRQWSAAEKYYRRMKRRSPSSFLTAAGLARCLYHLGEKPMAVREWDEAIERIMGEAPTGRRQGLAARALAFALLGRSLISMELGPQWADRAVDDASDAVVLLESLSDQGEKGMVGELLCARLLEAASRLEKGETGRGLEGASRAIDETMRARLDGGGAAVQPAVALQAMYLLVRTLEKAVERLSGNEQAAARRVLMAATLKRGYLIMSVGVYSPAIEDADRALALIEKVPLSSLDGRSRAFTKAEAYRLRMLCHAWLGREAEVAGDVASVRRYALLELADADRVVHLDEALLASREDTPRDWADAVVEMRLGKTLAGRGILHAQQGRHRESISDLDRSVAVLGQHVRSVTALDQLNYQKAERNTPREAARQLLTRSLEMRESVMAGRIPRSPW